VRYPVKVRDDSDLVARLKAIAKQYPRYGYRRAAAHLRIEGVNVNHKRVRRLWVQAALALPARRPRKRRPRASTMPVTASYPNHVWTYDFMADRTTKGRKLRFLTVIDECTRECLAIEVKYSFPARAVIKVLERLFAEHGARAYLRSDNGAEFVANPVREWLEAQGTTCLFIDPGSPWQSPFGESFNGRVRDECLNLELFSGASEASVIVAAYRRHFNHDRPHSSLGSRTPAEFKSTFGPTPAGALSPHPQSLPLSGPPDGQEEGQSQRPCPSVRPPDAALGSLSSVALSSAQAVPV
jgi:putative transposase